MTDNVTSITPKACQSSSRVTPGKMAMSVPAPSDSIARRAEKIWVLDSRPMKTAVTCEGSSRRGSDGIAEADCLGFEPNSQPMCMASKPASEISTDRSIGDPVLRSTPVTEKGVSE